MKKISVVVPCYNEQEALPIFYVETTKELEKIPNVTWEFVLVDDGSKDKTLETMQKLAEKDEKVKYISFSRNFGKESAMYAGLENATGDYVVLMDADLQDPPALLGRMVKEIEENGYDCVGTRRVTRKGEPPIRSFFARMFYKLINKISKTEIVDGARDFRMMKREMVDAVVKMCEYNRFSKGILSWVGFKTLWLEYENIERVAGTTKWNFWKLFLYSIDGIVAFSTAPLVISSVLGIAICFVAFCLMAFYVVKAIVFGDPVSGFPTLISVILMLGGLQLLCLGILGQYLAKTYLETKNRPIYIVGKTNIEK
ncbi:MAG: glycosyltransferase family 2 protein [Oscillospiraceae bacterium]|nr:glycosyltransferase family 2 protein [Oscillospiraceae bacterium]